jgi:hypothetical protein
LIRPLWAGVAGLALLGSAGAAAVYVVAAGGGEEEVVQVDSSATSIAASPTPTVGPTASPTPTIEATPSRAPSPISGKAPGGCVTSELVYQDPANRFAFCYPSDMSLRTSDPYEGKVGVAVEYPSTDPNWISVTIGWDQYPAYVPCQEAGEGFEVRNHRFEEMDIDGRKVSACFQDLYHQCIPDPNYPACNPGAFYFTKADFAVPVTTGRPVLVLLGYTSETATRNGVTLTAIWNRFLNSLAIN